MVDYAPGTATATPRLRQGLGIAVLTVLVAEMLAYALLLLLMPVQLGVEIGRLFVGLPIQIAEPGIYLVVIWGAVSLLASAIVAVEGRLSDRGGLRAFQAVVLLTCGLLQVYAVMQLLRFLATWDALDRELVLTSLLLIGPVGVLLACAVMWVRALAGARRAPVRTGWWAASAIGVLAVALAVHGSTGCTRFSFSSPVWKQGKGGWVPAPTTRQLSVERLLKCQPVEGKKARVRELLGKPTQEFDSAPGLAASWYYDLGPKRAIISVSGYTETLDVSFGRRGQVRSVAVLGKD
ncbi:MAG: hypothetical protein LC790_15420 [Actinobacteria bacterium]|nr:hypothetical protein [Actinomycetota bacterium]